MGDTGRRQSRMIRSLMEEWEEENLKVIPALGGGSVMHWKLIINTWTGHQSWSRGKEVGYLLGASIQGKDFRLNRILAGAGKAIWLFFIGGQIKKVDFY